MRIIPAMDIIDGKCVRLTKGDYNTKKIYNQDPVEVAKAFQDNGIQFLHLVDLDGARSSHIVNHKVLSAITSATTMSIDFGGGVKSNKDIKIAFDNGASQVTAGSVAITDKQLFHEWLSTYGADKIILGADCVERKVRSMGWTEDSGTDVVDFISDYANKGITNVICTDISKDGMLEGSADELYTEIMMRTPVNLIASGGVTTISDIQHLQSIGCYGVIIGKALYEHRITLKELSELC